MPLHKLAWPSQATDFDEIIGWLRQRSAGRRSAAKLLSKDEVRRIAANIAKLSDLLHKPR